MVKKINMKGGGNEVIIIIAVLLICVLIGGAAIVLWPDDLKACPSGSNTTAVTDKCKCSDGHECETGKYCYDNICHSSAETTSPDPPDATAAGTCVESATPSVVADAALCAAVTGSALNSATACDAVMTTADATTKACTYSSAAGGGGGGGGDAAAAAAAAEEARRLAARRSGGGGLDCKGRGRCDDNRICFGSASRPYYTNVDSTIDNTSHDFCLRCPTGSHTTANGQLLEDCQCSRPQEFLNTGADGGPQCVSCPTGKVPRGAATHAASSDICGCSPGFNENAAGDCVSQPKSPGAAQSIFSPPAQGAVIDISLRKYLYTNWPACEGGSGCHIDTTQVTNLNNGIECFNDGQCRLVKPTHPLITNHTYTPSSVSGAGTVTVPESCTDGTTVTPAVAAVAGSCAGGTYIPASTGVLEGCTESGVLTAAVAASPASCSSGTYTPATTGPGSGGVGEFKCNTGYTLQTSGADNNLSCEINQCLLQEPDYNDMGVPPGEQEPAPLGLGCLLNSDQNLVRYDTNDSKYKAYRNYQDAPDGVQVDPSVGDKGDIASYAKDLCGNGETCVPSEASCNAVTNDTGTQSSQCDLAWEVWGNKCSCKNIKTTAGGENFCALPDCSGAACIMEPSELDDSGATLVTAGVQTTLLAADATMVEINSGTGPGAFVCPCLYGTSHDSTGQCTVESGENRDQTDQNIVNGWGLCQNGSEYNASWDYSKFLVWKAQNTDLVREKPDGSYLSMSYEEPSGSGIWVHECSLPTTNAEETKNFTPFTRYKCLFNNFLDQGGQCHPITHECAKKSRTPSEGGRFTGFHYKYGPQCLIEGIHGSTTQADSDACCESCSDQFTEYSTTASPTELLTETDRSHIFNSPSPFYAGVGYNTRPKTSSTGLSGWGGTISATNKEQKIKDLFVCQKTDFDFQVGQGNSLSSPGTEIGKYPKDNTADTVTCGSGNWETCQYAYKHFDPQTRTTRNEDYLWMKDGTDYNWDNATLQGTANAQGTGTCPPSNPHSNFNGASNTAGAWSNLSATVTETLGVGLPNMPFNPTVNDTLCNLTQFDRVTGNNQSTTACGGAMTNSSFYTMGADGPTPQRCNVNASWARQDSVPSGAPGTYAISNACNPTGMSFWADACGGVVVPAAVISKS
jgi:hypothetical protein